jgi:hypothetical protein
MIRLAMKGPLGEGRPFFLSRYINPLHYSTDLLH